MDLAPGNGRGHAGLWSSLADPVKAGYHSQPFSRENSAAARNKREGCMDMLLTVLLAVCCVATPTEV